MLNRSVKGLYEWIEKQKYKGSEKEQVRQALLGKGWDEEKFSGILDSIYSGEHVPDKQWYREPRIMAAAVVVVLLIAGMPWAFTGGSYDAVEEEQDMPRGAGGCGEFYQDLFLCEPNICEYEQSGEFLERSIIFMEGECQYSEQMPGGGKMDCVFDEDMRKAVSRFLRDTGATETGFEASLNKSTGTMYTIDSKQVDNPLQEALLRGDCVITGYDQ